MTLLEQLRKPEEVKRWFDQIGDQAANEIESLQQQLAAMTQELADTKAQLTQESQDSINKQTIIDGLRSERARNEDTLIQRNQKLTTLTTRLAQVEEALKTIAGYAGENGCCPYGCDTPFIAKQAQCDPEDWAREAIREYMDEHRSGKDHVVPDYEERNGTDFDHERSHV